MPPTDLAVGSPRRTQTDPIHQDHKAQNRFNTLRLSMFANDEKGFPHLKGKAAELRHFAPALKETFEEHMVTSNLQHKQVVRMLDIAIRMESLLDEHADAYILPAEARGEFRLCCFSFVQLNTQLGAFYHRRGVLLFSHTIKMHYMCHIGLVADYINPRLGWCYAGEDFMKRIKKLVQSSAAGTGAHLVTTKAMKKYIHGVGLALHDEPWDV